MYEMIKNVIESGTYELADMLKKIDVVWIQNNITDEQKLELINLAREYASAGQEIHVLTKLMELDERVRKLEQASEESTGNPEEEYPDYVEGKWYYKDDKCTYNGEKYICVAPEGQVCTWSPDEYPAYWSKVEW